MAKPKYLRVRNWDRYQHFQTGRRAEAPMQWAKLYAELLDNRDFMEDTRTSTKWLAVALMCLAMRSKPRNTIPFDEKWIARETSLNTQQVRDGITELTEIGFVARLSARTADINRISDGYPRAEAEKNRDKGRSVARPPARTPAKRAAPKKKPDEHHLKRLLASIKDADEGTERVLRKHTAGFPVAALEAARERILENNVRSPAKLAVHLFTRDREFRACYGKEAA